MSFNKSFLVFNFIDESSELFSETLSALFAELINKREKNFTKIG